MNTQALLGKLQIARSALLDIAPEEWAEGDPLYGRHTLERDLNEVLNALTDLQYRVAKTVVRTK